MKTSIENEKLDQLWKLLADYSNAAFKQGMGEGSRNLALKAEGETEYWKADSAIRAIFNELGYEVD